VLTAGGKELLERTYAAPGLDDNLKAFADDLILAVTGKPGLATSRIVFVSDKSGVKQVYLCDPNGREVQQVTHHSHGCVSPSLNVDGSAVAYTSYRNGFPVVQVLALGLGWERTVTDTPGSSFGAAFSPDGNRLALVMSFLGNPEVFVTDLTSNTAACISDSMGAPGSPAWHPDGKQIIFSDDRGDGPRLYVTEVPETSQSTAKLIRWRAGYDFCADPEFSPDGSSVAFTARVGKEMAVVVKGWPGGASKVIQAEGASHPSWSPNGRYLCYSQRGILYVHNVLTGERRAVLEKHGQISEPRWMK
jgi:TolB protein